MTKKLRKARYTRPQAAGCCQETLVCSPQGLRTVGRAGLESLISNSQQAQLGDISETPGSSPANFAANKGEALWSRGILLAQNPAPLGTWGWLAGGVGTRGLSVGPRQSDGAIAGLRDVWSKSCWQLPCTQGPYRLPTPRSKVPGVADQHC